MTLALIFALVLSQARDGSDVVNAADAALNGADFQGALTLLDRLDARTTSPTVLIRAHLLRAECLIALQRPGEADAAFADALRLNPNLSLAPNAPQKLRTRFDGVKTKLLGTLEISSNLNGANALLDGKAIGPLPITAVVVAGKHTVKIDSADSAVVREVEVLAGKTTSVVLDVTTRAAEVVAVSPGGSSRSRVLPFTLVGVGVAGAVAGGVLVGTSLSWNSVDKRDLTIDEAVGRYGSAQTQHTVGVAVLVVGGAAACAGIAWLLLGSSDASTAAVLVPTSNGAVVGVAGRF